MRWLTLSYVKILQGGHTFKQLDIDRISASLSKVNIRTNPFLKNDIKTKKGQNTGGAEAEKETEFTAQQMSERALTLANPPDQEIVLVFRSTEERDDMFAVFRRYSQTFEAKRGSEIETAS